MSDVPFLFLSWFYQFGITRTATSDEVPGAAFSTVVVSRAWKLGGWSCGGAKGLFHNDRRERNRWEQ